MALINPRALQFVEKYGFLEPVKWVEENLRYTSNADLELFSTVDFAALELEKEGNAVLVNSVRNLIAIEPERAPKLDRELFPMRTSLGR